MLAAAAFLSVPIVAVNCLGSCNCGLNLEKKDGKIKIMTRDELFFIRTR
jgi:hypothetical protein